MAGLEFKETLVYLQQSQRSTQQKWNSKKAGKWNLEAGNNFTNWLQRVYSNKIQNKWKTEVHVKEIYNWNTSNGNI